MSGWLRKDQCLNYLRFFTIGMLFALMVLHSTGQLITS